MALRLGRFAASLSVNGVGALFLCGSTALAGTAGVGAAGESTRSLASNPALAIGARGTELAGDLQSTLVFLTYQRAGLDDEGERFPRERAFLHGEVPYIAIRSDAFKGKAAGGQSGNLGLGFSLSLPFSSGAHYSSGSAGRYHVIDATTYSVYLAPAVSIRPVAPVRVGAAPVIAVSRLSVVRRVDLAPALGDLLGCDHSVPDDCPPAESGALEGEFKVKDATGVAPTYQFGAAWDFVPGRGVLGASYTGGTLITLRGRSHLTPSLDFNVRSDADFQYTQYLPPIANAGVRWRFSPEIAASFEGQWIGYSASRKAVSRIQNSELKGTQGDLDALLQFLDINEGQLVEGILDKEQTTIRGWQNAYTAVAGVDYYLEWMRVHVEGGFFSHATPDQYVSTSNLDFDNYTIGTSVEYWVARKISLGLNVNQFINGGRHVRNSNYAGDKPGESGLAYPSGNGDYNVSATRVNVTAHLRF